MANRTMSKQKTLQWRGLSTSVVRHAPIARSTDGAISLCMGLTGSM